jgi:hypothetical protein
MAREKDNRHVEHRGTADGTPAHLHCLTCQLSWQGRIPG